MEFKTLLEKRRSVRKFAPTAVPSEVVDRLLAETLGAPSSRNSRSTRLLVVDDPEVVARMASMRDYGSAFMKGAPLAIVVLGDTACGASMPPSRRRCSTWPASTRGSPRAGSTSTDVPASRRSLRGSRRPTICGRSSPFPRGANRSARWPSAIRTSCRRRCPRLTTASASSASEPERPERPGWPGRPGDAALRSCRKTGAALRCAVAEMVAPALQPQPGGVSGRLRDTPLPVRPGGIYRKREPTSP